MGSVMSLLSALFNALAYSFLGLPLIAWVVIPSFFVLIGKFIKGKK